MKTCSACGRPLASHGGKAAIQSSEIGPKADDVSCCDAQATATPESPETAQATSSAAKQQPAKQRSRARRRKKLGQFLPARITMRPRPKIAPTASDAKRPRRRPALRFRPKRRLAKPQHLVSNLAIITVPSPSEAASEPVEQSPQTPPVEQRTEQPKQLIATSAGQFLLWLPIDVRSDAGEQSHQVHIIETQLEQKTGETEPVIAALASARQLELSWPSKATADAGEQLSETHTVESPLEQSPKQSEQVIATLLEDINPDPPSQITSGVPDESSQTQPAEPELDASAEDNRTDTTLFQTEELVFVPWRTAEPPNPATPAPATPPLEEQTKTPPAPVAEAPAEQSASQAYAMIPPAPSARVPGRKEFEARLQTLANAQSKESSVEEQMIEVVPGLVADSTTAPNELTTEKPVEPDPATAKTEEAVEESKPTSVSTPPTNETSVSIVTNPIGQETTQDISAKTEERLLQTLAPEPESKTASGEGDDAANANLQQPAKKKVLVVDDDPTLRMLLRMGLEPHGYECLLAEHGKAAQAVVEASHPALILVDLLMPVMDGIAFVQWLRGTAKDSTPVLVFTNLDDAKITQQALDSGANAFACKPLRLKELLQTMKELVPT